jgi:excisionase family DNA binding protein
MEKISYIMDENDVQTMIKNIVSELKKNEQPTVEAEKPEKLLTTKEACELLRCSKPTLHRWKKAGLVPFLKIGVNVRYRESDLKKIIETKK